MPTPQPEYITLGNSCREWIRPRCQAAEARMPDRLQNTSTTNATAMWGRISGILYTRAVPARALGSCQTGKPERCQATEPAAEARATPMENPKEAKKRGLTGSRHKPPETSRNGEGGENAEGLAHGQKHPAAEQHAKGQQQGAESKYQPRGDLTASWVTCPGHGFSSPAPGLRDREPGFPGQRFWPEFPVSGWRRLNPRSQTAAGSMH